MIRIKIPVKYNQGRLNAAPIAAEKQIPQSANRDKISVVFMGSEFETDLRQMSLVILSCFNKSLPFQSVQQLIQTADEMKF